MVGMTRGQYTSQNAGDAAGVLCLAVTGNLDGRYTVRYNVSTAFMVNNMMDKWKIGRMIRSSVNIVWNKCVYDAMPYETTIQTIAWSLSEIRSDRDLVFTGN